MRTPQASILLCVRPARIMNRLSRLGKRMKKPANPSADRNPKIRRPTSKIGISKLKILVSSTLQDLAAHRQAVAEAIRGLDMSNLEVTERGSSIQNILEANRLALRNADVFVGIYAACYGDLIN